MNFKKSSSYNLILSTLEKDYPNADNKLIMNIITDFITHSIVKAFLAGTRFGVDIADEISSDDDDELDDF